MVGKRPLRLKEPTMKKDVYPLTVKKVPFDFLKKEAHTIVITELT